MISIPPEGLKTSAPHLLYMLSLSTPVIGLAVLLVGVQVVYSALDMLNISYGAAAVRDADTWIRDGLNISDPERILAYQRSTTILSRIQSWVGLAILLAIVVTEIYTDLTRALTQTGLTPSIQGVLLIAGAVAGSRFLSAPFDLYKTFVIEDRFGFNNQTVMLWLRDWIIGLMIGLIAATLIGGTVLWVIEAVPSLWPVLGWLIVIGVSLATMVIYPRVIAPLFNDFEPIESGALRDAVEDVFSRAGFDCEQIYEMDASRRSSHSNAYFIGFGRAKRVVLFDTLIEQMSTNSIQAVLAHELAHWKKAHIWKQLVASTIQMGAVFAFLWWITSSEWVYTAFNFPSVTYAALGIGLLYAGPVLGLLSPVTNRLSLSHEREADDFAAETMGGPAAMTQALQTLAGENLQNPFPHPAYAAFHMTHPPIPTRIRRLREQYGDDNINDGLLDGDDSSAETDGDADDDPATPAA